MASINPEHIVSAPTRETAEERRRGYTRRGVVCALAFALLVAGVLVPHIGVVAAEGTYGRSLFPTSRFFLNANATAEAFAQTTDIDSVAAGINIAYFGLSFQHLGLLFGVFTFWAMAAATVGRWTRRGMLLTGWLYLLSAPTVGTAYLLLVGGNIPSFLGAGWFVSLLTGILFLLGGRAAKDRLDSTWYWARPEWNG